MNYISKYLIQYVPNKKTVNTGKCVTGARVLKSEECSKLIFEREEKKRKEQEEKQIKKAEREVKKKEKEEAAKKKRGAAKEKEEASRKKVEAASTRSQLGHKRITSGEEASSSNKKQNVIVDDSVQNKFENQCCVCFRTYEEDQLEQTGLQWVQRVCKRWIHEDCYEEILTDKYGRELICLYRVI